MIGYCLCVHPHIMALEASVGALVGTGSLSGGCFWVPFHLAFCFPVWPMLSGNPSARPSLPKRL